jgi:hypothetical protein
MIRRGWLSGRKGSEQAKKQKNKNGEREAQFKGVICTDVVIHLAVIKTKFLWIYKPVFILKIDAGT